MDNVERLRVAVISSESRKQSNYLWTAAADEVRELLLIGPKDTCEPLGPNQYALRCAGPWPNKQTFRILQGLNSLLSSFRPDLIHVNSELWSVTTQEVCFRREALVVHGAENLFKQTGVAPRIRTAVMACVIPRLNGYASWNRPGIKYFEQTSRTKAPTLLLPAIIPPPIFRSIEWRGSHHADKSAPFEVLVVGRVEAQKGFDQVIQAISLVDSPTGFRLNICGDGPDVPYLLRMASQLQVDVRHHGHVSPAELADLMSYMDCLVQPSQTTQTWAEQFGRAVAEGMTVGVPCLASSSGELPQLVDLEWCVFGERDTLVISHKLQELSANPAKQDDISKHQRKIAFERWSPSAAAAAVGEFWRSAYAHRTVHT